MNTNIVGSAGFNVWLEVLQFCNVPSTQQTCDNMCLFSDCDTRYRHCKRVVYGRRESGRKKGIKERNKGRHEKNRYTMRNRRRHEVKNKVGKAKRRKEDKKINKK